MISSGTGPLVAATRLLLRRLGALVTGARTPLAAPAAPLVAPVAPWPQ